MRALTRLAQSNGLQGIAENSGRAKVSKLAEEILALDISQAVRKQVQRALDAYIATFGQAGQNVDASAPMAEVLVRLQLVLFNLLRRRFGSSWQFN